MARGPWPVGTLLAYRITSSNSDTVRNSPLWNHYVLLRVVKVEPFFGGNRKSMAVCLYDWIGDTLPDPEIAKELSFTYFSIRKPLLSGLGKNFLTANLKKIDIASETKIEVLDNLTKPSYCTYELLDWRCAKGIDKKAVFTPLGCDPSFVDHVPEIFYQHTGGVVLTHSIPLDVDLVKRFSSV